jgi:hypothetical protein
VKAIWEFDETEGHELKMKIFSKPFIS